MAEPPDITQLLHAASSNEESAQEQLLEAVYGQLYRIAAARMSGESAAHTLQPTALINEAYPRLMGQSQWRDRAHFLGAAAEAMRRILIDHARRRNRQKRGGEFQRRELDDIPQLTSDDSEELLLLDSALAEFEKLDSLRASVVKLKFFCGLKTSDIADTLNLSLRTVERHWTFAKAWLQAEMNKR